MGKVSQVGDAKGIQLKKFQSNNELNVANSSNEVVQDKLKSLEAGGEVTSSTDPIVAQERATIPRVIGPIAGTAFIIGNMIGSGIFVSPKGILARSGSVGLSLCIWVACGVLSTLGALCYIELGLLITKSGGTFVYLLNGFSPLHRFFGPLPAFLCSWMGNVVSKPVSIAIISLACAKYCIAPFYSGVDPPPLLVPFTAVGICALVVLMQCYSTRLGAATQSLFTVAKLLALAVIIGAGMYSLAQGSTQHLASGFNGTTSSGSDIAKAFYGGMWAYGGWNSLNNLTEELVNPARNLPLAVLLALPLVTFVYLMTNIAYFTQLSPAELLASPAVAATFADKVLGAAAFIVPLGVALSTLGALNGFIMGTTRSLWSSAREGHLPEPLGYIHAGRLTPVPALLYNAIVSSVMMFLGDIGTLIEFFSFSVWIFNGLAVLSLIVMRRTLPDRDRPFRVPILIPWLVLAMACFLVVAPLVDKISLEYLYVLGFILLGVVVYTVFVYRQWSPSCTPSVYAWIQNNLALVPATQTAMDEPSH